MSPARLLSRLNATTNYTPANSNPASANGGNIQQVRSYDSSPIRASKSRGGVMSTGRSLSRSKTPRANSNPRNQSKEMEKKGGASEKSVAVDFVPLTVTHTVSKPSPSRNKSASASATKSRVTSGSANDFFDNMSIPTSYSNGSSSYSKRSSSHGHTRVPSTGSIPTSLYSNSNGSRTSGGSGTNQGHHYTTHSSSVRRGAAGGSVGSSVPASSSSYSNGGYYGDAPHSPVVVGSSRTTTTTPQRQYYHQQQQRRMHTTPPPPPPPPPPPKFEFEATPPQHHLPTTSPTQLIPDGFFSSTNSVYGDSTTQGGSSIDESLNGEDHMNDLLGVLNDEEKERYFLKSSGGGGNDDWSGVGKATAAAAKGRDENFRVDENERRDDNPVSHTPRRGYYSNTTMDQRGQDDDEEVSPRKMQQQQHGHEVRVSVVTPTMNQKQHPKQQNITTTTTTTNESPTSIFSIFNCGDITNDISETLSLIFSPQQHMTKNTPQQKQQQQQQHRDIRTIAVPEDEEEEERILMKKLQRLREKKWRGRSSSRTRART